MVSKSSRARRKAGTSLPISDAASPAVGAPARKSSEKPHYAGHRERLRARLLSAGAEALPDYELLELVLFAAIPQQDVKPLAKLLIETFGSFSEVIAAPVEALKQVTGVKDGVAAQIKIVEAAAIRHTRTKLRNAPVLSSWQALVDYCIAAHARSRHEEFRVLYLNRKNVLIADEVLGKGTVDHTPVYPREVMKRALEHGASAIILVHNHPSGDPTPSRPDIEMTREIATAAASLGIQLHDHIVVGRGGTASFKSLGLL